ncbi:hypothetical protein SOASR014_35570 [Pectobacterium carotovorum subsp. carotovorum]|nr:hypothetical protein SOASR014_35570 [Pectobacterium carotovorum subsp. carotovorum]GLX45954.1 hypothetical protein Pcaca01_36220 [Pectobacterium carotovorum subsp. carotovorum]
MSKSLFSHKNGDATFYWNDVMEQWVKESLTRRIQYSGSRVEVLAADCRNVMFCILLWAC